MATDTPLKSFQPTRLDVNRVDPVNVKTPPSGGVRAGAELRLPVLLMSRRAGVVIPEHRPAELHGSHHCLSKYCSLSPAALQDADVPTFNPECKTLLALFRPAGRGPVTVHGRPRLRGPFSGNLCHPTCHLTCPF